MTLSPPKIWIQLSQDRENRDPSASRTAGIRRRRIFRQTDLHHLAGRPQNAQWFSVEPGVHAARVPDLQLKTFKGPVTFYLTRRQIEFGAGLARVHRDQNPGLIQTL